MDDTDTRSVVQEAPETEEVEDTADVQTTEAGESVKESPEATQEKGEQKENAETEVKAEDTEEKLYAGKYKTPEEMEKAYKNLESKFGQETSKRAELSQQLNQSVAPAEADTAGSGIPDQLARDTAVLKFVVSHPDADGQTMNEVLTNDPYIDQINSYEARLEYAYAKAQGMSQAKAIEEAKKQATTETHAKIAEKEVAQVESAQRAEPVDESEELAKRMRSGDPDVRKRARQEYIKKNLVNL